MQRQEKNWRISFWYVCEKENAMETNKLERKQTNIRIIQTSLIVVTIMGIGFFYLMVNLISD